MPGVADRVTPPCSGDSLVWRGQTRQPAQSDLAQTRPGKGRREQPGTLQSLRGRYWLENISEMKIFKI